MLKEKTDSIKKVSRQKQLDLRFNSIRKHMVRTTTKQEVQQRRQQQSYLIWRLLNSLKQNEPNAIFKLWQHCLSFSFRYLTQNQILFLVSKIGEIKKSSVNTEDVIMGIWLISNWATTVVNLKQNFDQLIYLLTGLLDENPSQKLQQHILYTFTNLCSDFAFAKRLMQLSILEKVVDCRSSLHKEGDVSLLLRNCLHTLPSQFQIEVNLSNKIISFIKRALKKCKQDFFLRSDSFFILTKLLNLSLDPHTDRATRLAEHIILQLGPQLKALFLTVQSITQVKSCLQMFSLLTNIAKKCPKSVQFFDQELQKSLWTSTKGFLSLQSAVALQDQQDFNELVKEIWIFLPLFLRAVNQSAKQQILQWLLEQCLFESSIEWEEKALVILAKHLTEQDEILELCQAKLETFKVLDEPAQAMLQSLCLIVAKNERAVMKLKSKEQLYLCVSNLQFDQRQEIAHQAQKILKKLEEVSTNNKRTTQIPNSIEFTRMQEERESSKKDP